MIDIINSHVEIIDIICIGMVYIINSELGMIDIINSLESENYRYHLHWNDKYHKQSSGNDRYQWYISST